MSTIRNYNIVARFIEDLKEEEEYWDSDSHVQKMLVIPNCCRIWALYAKDSGIKITQGEIDILNRISATLYEEIVPFSRSKKEFLPSLSYIQGKRLLIEMSERLPEDFKLQVGQIFKKIQTP
jgi:hypothetical protein